MPEAFVFVQLFLNLLVVYRKAYLPTFFHEIAKSLLGLISVVLAAWLVSALPAEYELLNFQTVFLIQSGILTCKSGEISLHVLSVPFVLW